MFSDDLIQLGAPLLEVQKKHPFVLGIAKGSLSEERVSRWLGQDLLYLESYARTLAYGAAKAPGLESMRKWSAVLALTLGQEMEGLRHLAEAFSLDLEELAAQEMLPATRAYGDFLLGVAATGSLGEIIACHLPCAWDYHQVALHLMGMGLPEDPRYAGWIEQYASDEFREMAAWLKSELDGELIRTGEGPAYQHRLQDLFITATRHELRFWDMCWQGDSWPGNP